MVSIFMVFVDRCNKIWVKKSNAQVSFFLIFDKAIAQQFLKVVNND